MSISTGDRFVIVASQTLVALSGASTEFEVVCETIVEANQAAQQHAQTYTPEEHPDVGNPIFEATVLRSRS
jgi:hypothetical protein